MKPLFLNTTLAFIALLFLSACQNPVVEHTASSAYTSVHPDTWVTIPANTVKLHAAIELPSPPHSTAAATHQRLTVRALYTSALGRTCMQLTNPSMAVPRVLCQVEGDLWQPMPFFNAVSATAH